MWRVIYTVLLIFYVATFSSYSQKLEKLQPDFHKEEIEQLNIELDSLKSEIAKHTNQINSLSDSIKSINRIEDPVNITTLVVTIFSGLLGAAAIIMAFLTFQSKSHLNDSIKAAGEANHAARDAKAAIGAAKEAKEEVNKIRSNFQEISENTSNTLAELKADLQRNFTENRKYAEYFLVFFNNAMPPYKRLDQKLVKHVLDLASFNQDERFRAISQLKEMAENDDRSVVDAILYLEWVIKHRSTSKDDAEDAIKTIRGKFPPAPDQ
nr:hypothetical protein [candidate division Zixibacteria bacterium]